MIYSHAETLQQWIQMWEDGVVHVDDVVLTFEEAIAEDANPTYFERAPIPIRDAVLHDIEVFRRSGKRVVVVKDTGREISLTEKMNRLVQVLTQAGHL